MKTAQIATILFSLSLAACGGGSSSSGGNGGGSNGGNNGSGTGGMNTEVNGALPNAMNQTFTCGADSNSAFLLSMTANGSFQVGENNIITQMGTYSLNNGIQFQFTAGSLSGQSSSATRYEGNNTLLVGMVLDVPGNPVAQPCIARTHQVGDKLSSSETVVCGQPNIPGQSADYFDLSPDGSAQWRNHFETQNDTIYKTAYGTYIFDAASGNVDMAFGNGDSVAYVSAKASNGTVQITSTKDPLSGTSATTGASCSLAQ